MDSGTKRILTIVQVAVDRTAPNGRVVGIDIIPAQPPKGASTIQGNFLSRTVQEEVKNFLRDPDRGRPRQTGLWNAEGEAEEMAEHELGYVDMERRADLIIPTTPGYTSDGPQVEPSGREKDDGEKKMVDVLLSDMSAPWEQTTGFWKRSLSDPYFRMMNTSGMNFRDHVGSMVWPQQIYSGDSSCSSLPQDLCGAALAFAFDTLRSGGHFVCKFYQGSEEKALEARLKILFSKVHREKPESSRAVRILDVFFNAMIRS